MGKKGETSLKNRWQRDSITNRFDSTFGMVARHPGAFGLRMRRHAGPGGSHEKNQPCRKGLNEGFHFKLEIFEGSEERVVRLSLTRALSTFT
jgi:hypothetical protein